MTMNAYVKDKKTKIRILLTGVMALFWFVFLCAAILFGVAGRGALIFIFVIFLVNCAVMGVKKGFVIVGVEYFIIGMGVFFSAFAPDEGNAPRVSNDYLRLLIVSVFLGLALWGANYLLED